MKISISPFVPSSIILALFLVLAPDAVIPAEPLARITIKAGKHPRIDTPVSISLGGIPVSLDIGLRLEEIRNSRRLPVPSQIEPGDAPRLWWIVTGSMPAGDERVYELVTGEPVVGPVIEVRRDETALDIYCGKMRVLRYNHALIQPSEEASPLYTRSGFIHPFWSPAGKVFTRIHPEDHIHHLGLWNPWTRTKFEGREVDFWNLGSGQGTVRFVKFISTTSGSVFGGFRAFQEHVDLTAPGGEKVALNEEWDIRVWSQGGPDKGYWLWDFTTTQRCASSSPVELLKYRYGGFGFRATGEWNENNSDYLTSAGKTRKDGHGTRARWCNVYGTTTEGPGGVLFMSHPHNHEHPEPMRIWPQGDVFFNFCPIQKADWTLEPGHDYVLRYRLYAYDGTLTPEAAERLWRDFGQPPEVMVKWK